MRRIAVSFLAALTEGLTRRPDIHQHDLSARTWDVSLALAKRQGTPPMVVTVGAHVLLDTMGP
jgi:hypothetical protein